MKRVETYHLQTRSLCWICFDMAQDHEPMEGPNPRVESRLCMLLSIVPIASGIVIDEEEKGHLFPENTSGDEKERKVPGGRRAALETCLQVLGQFESLLIPPVVAVTAANQVAAKVVAFVSSGGANMNADNSSTNKSAGLYFLVDSGSRWSSWTKSCLCGDL